MTDKQKICLINSCKTWGGGEKWHFEIAQWLHASGLEVVCITDKNSDLNKKLKEKTSIECHGISLNNSSFLNLYKYIQLKKILAKIAPDTIVMSLPIDVKIAGYSAMRLGIKNRIYRRGSAIPVKNSFLNRYLFKYVVTNLIANSRETKRTILANNSILFPDHKIDVIYNGIELKKYDGDCDPEDQKSTVSRPGNEIILGNAGRLEEQKNQKDLIEVAAILKNQNINFKLRIAGIGSHRERLEAYAEECNVSDKIEFLGFITNIKEFMQSIDIFLLSSKWEGFGFVLAEAMACYKPIIAYDISSNPELIEDNVTGYLVPPFDNNEFAKKISVLIKDDNLRHEMGIKGRQKVEAEFSLVKTEETLNSYFERIYIESNYPKKISAAIITLNEERNIEKCLQSLENLVDEIVVIDSFSTDRTEEICKRYNVKFIKHAFDGHIEQKNYAISQCSYDYVLAIDADEVISETLQKSILAAKQDWDADAYIFNRQTYYCGKAMRFGDWFPDMSLRLWDRRCGEWGGQNPHDRFCLVPGSSVRYLEGVILHYSYHSVEEHIAQVNKFSTISATSKFRNGKRSNILKIMFYPLWRFFRDYFIKLGFIDGYNGLIVCLNISHEVFLKYVKLKQLQNTFRTKA